VQELRLLLQAPVRFVHGYIVPLPVYEACSTDHVQPEHDTVTARGSMSKTRWAMDDDRAVVDVGGRKFGVTDTGAPMLVYMTKSLLIL
jgi:hypothetical protein